jgi:hypothetical protein
VTQVIRVENHELVPSLQRGVSCAWRVAERYVVQGDVVEPCGAPDDARVYAPAVHPELPGELARLTRGDTRSAVKFCETYGLLGYRQLTARPGASEGDPLIWVWTHAFTVRVCLHLTKLLQDADIPALEAYLCSLTIEGLTRDDAAYWPAATVARLECIETMIWSKGSTQLIVARDGTAHERAFDQAETLVDLARTIRRVLINQNMAQMARRLQARGPQEHSAFGFTALIELIYWLLADAIEGGYVSRCEACTALFTHRKPRQRFCPPRGRQKESACAIRSRGAKHRAKALAAR